MVLLMSSGVRSKMYCAPYFRETFIGFIEEITEESMSVQIVNTKLTGNWNYENIITPIFITGAEVLSVLFPRPTNQFLLENYYYRMEISYKNNQGTKIISKEWPELVDVFFAKEKNILERFWVNFEFDFPLTEAANDYVNKSFLKVSRGEKLYFSILEASSPKITSDSDYAKWRKDIEQCQKSLRKLMDNYRRDNNVVDYELFFTTVRLFNRRIQYKNEQENDNDNEKDKEQIKLEESVRVFIQQLISIEADVFLGNSKENNYVIRNFNEMLNVKGVGITSLSIMLHSLWSKSFPVYSTEVHEHLNKMNYTTWERSTANSFEGYRKTINNLISITYDSMRAKPDYVAISFFLKKRFSLHEIL